MAFFPKYGILEVTAEESASYRQIQRRTHMGLFSKKKGPKEELKQNLEEKAEFQNLYQIYLQFEEKPVKPDDGIIRTALE